MKPEKIKEMLALGEENQRTEFKAHIRNIDSLGRVVCGFLNSGGGYLVCGVDEHGCIQGVATVSDVISRLEKHLHEGISPKALVSVQTQELDQKSVVVIEVPSGKDVPYAFRDVIFI